MNNHSLLDEGIFNIFGKTALSFIREKLQNSYGQHAWKEGVLKKLPEHRLDDLNSLCEEKYSHTLVSLAHPYDEGYNLLSIADFRHIIKENWTQCFADTFEEKKDTVDKVYKIKEIRNKVAHSWADALPDDYTRQSLTTIGEFLSCIDEAAAEQITQLCEQVGSEAESQAPRTIDAEPEIIVDRTGAPLIRFSERKYISVLPVTKYQFERYIGDTAPEWCDYDALVAETGRVSPVNLTKELVSQAFVTNINFEEALDVAEWLGGRPCSVAEWDEVYDVFWKQDELFEKTLTLLNSEDDKQVDRRWIVLLEALKKFGISRAGLNELVEELVSECFGKSYGRISLKHRQGETARVPGSPDTETKNLHCGFSYIVEKR